MGTISIPLINAAPDSWDVQSDSLKFLVIIGTKILQVLSLLTISPCYSWLGVISSCAKNESIPRFDRAFLTMPAISLSSLE